MASKQKAITNFSRKRDDELLVETQTIIQAMDGNAYYPSPNPTLADVELLVSDFSLKLAVARKRGNPEDTALKNESRQVLQEALRHLAYYVNTAAQGVLSVLLSSGFPIGNKSKPRLVPLPVEGIRLSDGRQSGQVRLDFGKQHEAVLYEYRYRRLDITDVDWSESYSTTSSRMNIIAPLAIGVRYEVTVRAINSQGRGDWGQAVSILAR